MSSRYYLKMIIVLFALFLSQSLVSAQNCKDIPKQIEDSCANFFTRVQEDKIKDAYSALLRNSTVAKNEDQINNLIEQTARVPGLYGKMSGYEFVNCERVGSSLIRMRYITKHANFPMRWVFTFYNSPEHGWIIMTMKFDDSSDLFFTD